MIYLQQENGQGGSDGGGEAILGSIHRQNPLQWQSMFLSWYKDYESKRALYPTLLYVW